MQAWRAYRENAMKTPVDVNARYLNRAQPSAAASIAVAAPRRR